MNIEDLYKTWVNDPDSLNIEEIVFVLDYLKWSSHVHGPISQKKLEYLMTMYGVRLVRSLQTGEMYYNCSPNWAEPTVKEYNFKNYNAP